MVEEPTLGWVIKRYLSIIIPIALMVLLIFSCGMFWDGVEKRHLQEGLDSGELVDVDGRIYTVQKTTLTDGKCWYIYSFGGLQPFAIPCEENNVGKP